MAERVVLAFSGGLDTTVATRWLQETAGFEVITATVDLGGKVDLPAVRERARCAGAKETFVVDAREQFVTQFCWPALQASALYQDQYPLATALARPLIAERLVEIARLVGATAVAHGSTGKGNDQVRFELAVAALAPELRVLAPIRDGMGMNRDQEIAYALARGIPVPATKASPYSVDENLWGRSVEAGSLEDPALEPPADAFEWTREIADTPDGAETVEIEFEQGRPVKLDRSELPPVALVETLNQIGGRHGFGRIDMVEDRFVGIKSREVYEAPAAAILHLAHSALEQLVLDAESRTFNNLVGPEYARLVYQGKWFSKHRLDLSAYVAAAQQYVTGKVALKLHKGTARVIRKTSPHSLYRPALATYSEGDAFDQSAATGFLKLVGLPLRAQAEIQGVAGHTPELEVSAAWR